MLLTTKANTKTEKNKQLQSLHKSHTPQHFCRDNYELKNTKANTERDKNKQLRQIDILENKGKYKYRNNQAVLYLREHTQIQIQTQTNSYGLAQIAHTPTLL